MIKGEIKIVGFHPVDAPEPCFLIEAVLPCPFDVFDFAEITQEVPGYSRADWQVPWDEQEMLSDGDGSRCVFFFHYLDLLRPLITPWGEVFLPAPTPLPDHLSDIEYDEP